MWSQGVQAGPGPQEVQEGEGEAVDPLQAQSFPAHWHPFFSEGEGIHSTLLLCYCYRHCMHYC